MAQWFTLENHQHKKMALAKLRDEAHPDQKKIFRMVYRYLEKLEKEVLQLRGRIIKSTKWHYDFDELSNGMYQEVLVLMPGEGNVVKGRVNVATLKDGKIFTIGDHFAFDCDQPIAWRAMPSIPEDML